MTPEAALTKLSYVLGKEELTVDDRRRLMEENIRGELTVFPSQHQGTFTLKDSEIFQIVTKALRLSSTRVYI